MNTYIRVSRATARIAAIFTMLALLSTASYTNAALVPLENQDRNDSEQVVVCPALAGGTWADAVEASAQAKMQNGGDITDPERMDPAAALGEEDWDNGGSAGFFSLGFGGSVTLRFYEYVLNVPGTDLTVYEATNGDDYPLEEVEVEVSQNGSDWEQVDNADNTNVGDRTTAIDIDGSGFEWVRYVRLTDVSDPVVHDETADGFDLDAVFATSADCDEPNHDGSITITKVYGVEGEWSFDFTATDENAFTLTNAAPTQIFAAPAGVYTFAEVLSSEDATDLLDITCNEGANVVTDLILGTAVVTLAADEDVSCVFTNRPSTDDGGGDGDDGNDRLTCSLETDDASVNDGEEFTLSWETHNASQVTIDNGIGDVSESGSLVTSIEDDTTFTLTASRFTGEDETEESVTCSVDINERSSGGGGGTRVGRRDGGSDDGDGGGDDGPEGQVLGEQISIVPEGAPASGAGGSAPVASYAYFGTAILVRKTFSCSK